MAILKGGIDGLNYFFIDFVEFTLTFLSFPRKKYRRMKKGNPDWQRRERRGRKSVKRREKNVKNENRKGKRRKRRRGKNKKKRKNKGRKKKKGIEIEIGKEDQRVEINTGKLKSI